MEEIQKLRRGVAKWRLITLIVCLICIGLLVALIFVSLHSSKPEEEINCGSTANDIKKGEPELPSIFNDLTKKEIMSVKDFLYKQKALNLTQPGKPLRLHSSFIYLVELYMPKKEEAISYLDDQGPCPSREAIVTIFRGDTSDQHVNQIVVGPLPRPSYMKTPAGIPEKVPYLYRPFSMSELGPMYEFLYYNMYKELSEILLESFGGRLTGENCFGGGKCLVFYVPVPVSPAVSGKQQRMFWNRMHQLIDNFVLHPVGFAVLVGSDGKTFTIEKVSYNSELFDSLEEFKEAYKNGTVSKILIPFPLENEHLFSKLATRGKSFSSDSKSEPIQVEPDGKRYSLHYQHVRYFGWKFDFRMSSSRGPSIYDIQFQGERIAYEIGLQEISVLYSGKQVPQMMTDYFDSSALLGLSGKGMVPGIDCPRGATFIDASHFTEEKQDVVTFKNAMCLFELNTGMPLRRHHSFSSYYRSYFEGANSNVLILRTALTVLNYDYIFDFVFYNNGVFEVKATSTGYVLATLYKKDEEQYGTRIHDFINANLHTHLFNFKVDIDIKGTSNRFETLDILPKTVKNPIADDSRSYHMTQFVKSTKLYESDGAYKFNFDAPKYLIFSNNEKKDKYTNPKAYRLLVKDMVKQMFTEGEGTEPSVSWARYQTAVTKVKDTERHSGSFYAFMDADNSIINFQSFINDNESIVDQDLVAWVTIGVHHIPHTEDLPVTPTPGMSLNFFLLPYNYFSEDPGMSSKDAVRVEFKDPSDVSLGVEIKFAKHASDKQCMTNKNLYWELVKQTPSLLLDTGCC